MKNHPKYFIWLPIQRNTFLHSHSVWTSNANKRSLSSKALIRKNEQMRCWFSCCYRETPNNSGFNNLVVYFSGQVVQVWYGSSVITMGPGSSYLSLCCLQKAASILWYKVTFIAPVVIGVYISTSKKKRGGREEAHSFLLRVVPEVIYIIPAQFQLTRTQFHTWLKESLYSRLS